MPSHLPPTLIVADPASQLAEQVLRAYMEDVVSRYWGRPATAAEVERALREDPSEDLALPAGLFVVAVAGSELPWDVPIGLKSVCE